MKKFAVAYGSYQDGTLDIVLVEAESWRDALLLTDSDVFSEILNTTDAENAEISQEVTYPEDVEYMALNFDIILKVKEIE